MNGLCDQGRFALAQDLVVFLESAWGRLRKRQSLQSEQAHSFEVNAGCEAIKGGPGGAREGGQGWREVRAEESVESISRGRMGRGRPGGRPLRFRGSRVMNRDEQTDR